MVALTGTVRSLFPGDRALQDVVFPETAVAKGTDEVEDDPEPQEG